MQKVLVTGGAGFIGSHIVDTFINSGYGVVIVDDLSRGEEILILGQSFIKWIYARQNWLMFLAKEKPDFVDHHAARISVVRSLAEPSDDAEVNILGSLNLLQNCVRWGVKKFIFASSGGAIYGEPVYLPCDEAHPIAPISPYGVSKYAVELYLHSYWNNFGLESIVFRYANIYGPRQVAVGEARRNR